MCCNEEQWKEIHGYSNYLISTKGKVYSKIVSNYLNPTKNSNGYLRIQLSNDIGLRKTEFIHKLVLLTFVGPKPSPSSICRHYPDQNPENNDVCNLSWSDQIQNNYDRIENGTYNQAKLTPAEVIQIKTRLVNGEECKVLKEEYGISYAVLTNIKRNNIWKNIGPDISNNEFRRSGGQKLTISQVIQIKKLLRDTRLFTREIADMFDVDQSSISNIKNNKYYKDVTIPDGE